MVNRPIEMNQFEFAIVSSLRTAQLMRGCIPRVTRSLKPITTAQREVADGKVVGTWAVAPKKAPKPVASDYVRAE